MTAADNDERVKRLQMFFYILQNRGRKKEGKKLKASAFCKKGRQRE